MLTSTWRLKERNVLFLEKQQLKLTHERVERLGEQDSSAIKRERKSLRDEEDI